MPAQRSVTNRRPVSEEGSLLVVECSWLAGDAEALFHPSRGHLARDHIKDDVEDTLRSIAECIFVQEEDKIFAPSECRTPEDLLAHPEGWRTIADFYAAAAQI